MSIKWEKSALVRHEERALGILYEFGDLALVNYLENIDRAIVNIKANNVIGRNCPPPENRYLLITPHHAYKVEYHVEGSYILIKGIGKYIEC